MYVEVQSLDFEGFGHFFYLVVALRLSSCA